MNNDIQRLTGHVRRFLAYLSMVIIMLIFCVNAHAEDKFVLVLDAGHGGKDVGAVDNGVKEKDINLGVALKLGELVKKHLKDVKVVYTRDNDTFVTLQGRADKANKEKGNLFISIHTNSVDKSNKNRTVVSGASVYALGLHKDDNNLETARRENAVIELEKDYKQKYSGFDPNSDESYIIFEMAQKKNLSNSIRFANSAQKSLVGKSGRTDRGVHQAGFWVLWATSMPAVLVELDFICNPNSAKYLASEKGQQQMAEALFDAVKDYVKGYRSSLGSVEPSTDDRASEEVLYAAVGNPEAVAIAETPVKSDRKVEKQTAKETTKARPASRRRRGDAGKEASDARDVSTAEIPVRPASRPLPAETYAETKATADKPLTKAERKAKEKEMAKAKKKAEEEAKKLAKEEAKNKKHRGKVARLKTVYKIQIAVSDKLLSQSDARFCGLKPISYYMENNLYKYTYGEGASEEEMQKVLKEVRKKIPDAFIIKSLS